MKTKRASSHQRPKPSDKKKRKPSGANSAKLAGTRNSMATTERMLREVVILGEDRREMDNSTPIEEKIENQLITVDTKLNEVLTPIEKRSVARKLQRDFHFRMTAEEIDATKTYGDLVKLISSRIPNHLRPFDKPNRSGN